MNIIYISPCQEENEFINYTKTWKRTINSSNQNFHNKFIHALALSNHVDAISIRSISETYSTVDVYERKDQEENNISWHYLKVFKGNKLKEMFSLNKQIKELVKNIKEDSIILCDTINPTCTYLANKVARKFKLKAIGLVTDSPTYISNVNQMYTYMVYSQASLLSGYICLTERLNTTFNPEERPYIINEGIINSLVEHKKNKYGDYIFFGGSLLEKWGVYNLIEAYKQLNRDDIKLIIAGHHYNKERMEGAIKDNSNILFFECLPVKEVQVLQSNALVCVNPRPTNLAIDDFSIPSKVLEYLSSRSLVISTPHPILEKIFNDDEIIFTSDDSVFCLVEKLNYVLSLNDKQKEEIKEKGLQKVNKLYSFEAINKKIIPFLDKFLKD